MATLTGVSAKSARSIMSVDYGFTRTFHKAVKLPEGIGVIVGGQTQPPATADKKFYIVRVTTEAYDVDGRRTVTYQWTDLAHTVNTGQQAFGVSVSDIRTIVTGGHDGAGAPTNVYQILSYSDKDAINSLFSGTMLSARGGHGQATVGNKVLVCGGFATFGTEVATAAELNLDTLVWSGVASMKQARTEHSAVNVASGVLVSGGRQPTVSANKTLNTSEFWDGTAWSQVGSMRDARHGHAMVVLPNDMVVAIGGLGYNPSRASTPVALKSCEIWDGRSKAWLPIPDMADEREYPAAVYVAALNAVVVAGGRGKTSCEILDLKTMTWRKSLAVFGVERYRTQAIQLKTDLVMFAGGSNIVGIDDTTQQYNYLFVPAGESMWNGGLNGVFRVEAVPAADKFLIRAPGYEKDLSRSSTTSPSAHKFKATAADTKVPGPFILDPESGIAITGVSGATANKLLAGHQYLTLPLSTSLSATPAKDFPDEPGWLVFAFGEQKQLWPVRYLGRISNTELALDAAFVFPLDLPVGTTVTLAAQREPFAPSANLGLLYGTASSAGRIAASDAVDEAVAAGVPVDKEVVYPGDRGLGGEGYPTKGNYKLSDALRVWGGDDLTAEAKDASES